jgi:hypothetical protein
VGAALEGEQPDALCEAHRLLFVSANYTVDLAAVCLNELSASSRSDKGGWGRRAAAGAPTWLLGVYSVARWADDRPAVRALHDERQHAV